jgi:hypothetical protein
MSQSYAEAQQATDFIEAFTRCLGRERVVWERQLGLSCRLRGNQAPVDTSCPAINPAERAVYVSQDRGQFAFRNHWGFEVEAGLPAHASVSVYLSEVIELPEGPVSRDDLIGLAVAGEASRRPYPWERGTLRSLQAHNRALTAALRAQGFRRVGKHYSPPFIERCLAADGRILESSVWSDSKWNLRARTLEQLAESVSALMDCTWATNLGMEPCP